jgi:ATP-dependent phosphofructokinase / diphosphate-dependent phosphofructokinase
MTFASRPGDVAPDTLVVAQSGGPTPVINASLVGVVRAARAASTVQQVQGARYGFEGLLAGDLVNLSQLHDADLAILERTPSSALGSSRHRPSDEQVQQTVQSLVGQGVRWLLMIGGNDSADTLHRIHLAARALGSPLAVVGVPKTVDNDLPGMDHCPGYGSAARYLAMAMREAALDTEAMQRTDPVKIIEVAGRNAGWLAAAGALGRVAPTDAPQVVFLPERPRSVRQMVEEIGQAVQRNGWAVVALSENQPDADRRPLSGDQPVYVDPHGHPYFESPGLHLARSVQFELGLRARYERPGSLQRSSAWALSKTDLKEAGLAGADAARRALAGESDVMVAIQRTGDSPYRVGYDAVPLVDVAARERRMPDEFIAESGIDVTDAFLAYGRPLIGGPLPPSLRL